MLDLVFCLGTITSLFFKFVLIDILDVPFWSRLTHAERIRCQSYIDGLLLGHFLTMLTIIYRINLKTVLSFSFIINNWLVLCVLYFARKEGFIMAFPLTFHNRFNLFALTFCLWLISDFSLHLLRFNLVLCRWGRNFIWRI